MHDAFKIFSKFFSFPGHWWLEAATMQSSSSSSSSTLSSTRRRWTAPWITGLVSKHFHLYNLCISYFSIQVCQSIHWLLSSPSTPSPLTISLKTRKGAGLPMEPWSNRCSTPWSSFPSMCCKFSSFHQF